MKNVSKGRVASKRTHLDRHLKKQESAERTAGENQNEVLFVSSDVIDVFNATSMKIANVPLYDFSKYSIGITRI